MFIVLLGHPEWTRFLSVLHFDGLVGVQRMSKTESMQNRQKHVAARAQIFFKDYVFLRKKVINSNLMLQNKAIQMAMDHEAVLLHQ